MNVEGNGRPIVPSVNHRAIDRKAYRNVRSRIVKGMGLEVESGECFERGTIVFKPTTKDEKIY